MSSVARGIGKLFVERFIECDSRENRLRELLHLALGLARCARDELVEQLGLALVDGDGRAVLELGEKEALDISLLLDHHGSPVSRI